MNLKILTAEEILDNMSNKDADVIKKLLKKKYIAFNRKLVKK